MASVPVVGWGDLQIIDKLGEGGFADVFRAVYQGQVVCVKQWRCQELPPDQLHLFQREVQIGSMIRHPNCVTLFAICLQPLALVMEFVDGLDLYDLIHNPGFQLTVLSFAIDPTGD